MNRLEEMTYRITRPYAGLVSEKSLKIFSITSGDENFTSYYIREEGMAVKESTT